MATVSISQMATAASVDNGTLLEVATPDQNSASGYTSEKISVAQLADHCASDVNYPLLRTSAKSIVGAINETAGVIITGTLTAGSTSLVLSDAAVTTSSTIDIYTDVYGVNPTDVTVATGSITLTFDAQASDVSVKVRVM